MEIILDKIKRVDKYAVQDCEYLMCLLESMRWMYVGRDYMQVLELDIFNILIQKLKGV